LHRFGRFDHLWGLKKIAGSGGMYSLVFLAWWWVVVEGNRQRRSHANDHGVGTIDSSIDSEVFHVLIMVVPAKFVPKWTSAITPWLRRNNHGSTTKQILIALRGKLI
jgi:hypothetical protein